MDNQSRNLSVMRLPEVLNRTGLSRSSIYAYIKTKKFPLPLQLGERSVGWLESEINSWIAERTEWRNAK